MKNRTQRRQQTIPTWRWFSFNQLINQLDLRSTQAEWNSKKRCFTKSFCLISNYQVFVSRYLCALDLFAVVSQPKKKIWANSLENELKKHQRLFEFEIP